MYKKERPYIFTVFLLQCLLLAMFEMYKFRSWLIFF